MHLRKNLSILVVTFFLLTPIKSSAVLTAAAVVAAASAEAEDLINTAMDRLDLSLLRGAMELRATIAQSADIFEGVMDASFEQLDTQQMRVIADLQMLQRELAEDSKALLVELRKEKNQVLSDVKLVISNNPGSVRLVPGYVFENSEHIDFKIHGVALSNLEMENFKVNGSHKKYSIPSQSDTNMTIRVPLSKNFNSKLISKSKGKLGEINISFELHSSSFLFFKNRRYFQQTGFMIPNKIGLAKATFSGVVTKTNKKWFDTHKCHSSATSYTSQWGRFKRGSSGEKDCVVELGYLPEGWKYDSAKSKFEIELKPRSSGDCYHTGTYAGWAPSGQSSNKLHVKYRVMSDRGVPGWKRHCEATIKIKPYIFQTTKIKESLTSRELPIYSNSDMTLDIPNSQMKGARLSYVTIESKLFNGGIGGIKKLEAGKRLGALSVSSANAGKSALLRIRFQ